MSGENNFKDTVNSLFKGLDAFISAKTVVGEAIHVGDTIILPLLVDVSLGVGAGAFEGDKKSNGGGGMTGKADTKCCTCNPEWFHEACNCQNPGWTYQKFWIWFRIL